MNAIIDLMNVEHGACALVHAPNGRRAMIDCGHNKSLGWYPGQHLLHLGSHHLDRLFVSNFDEDHGSAFIDLRRRVSVRQIWRNPSLTPCGILLVKKQLGSSAGPNITALAAALQTVYTAPADDIDFGGVRFDCLWHNYPLFADTNNLSMMLFVSYGDHRILLPGDMERPGWLAMMGRPEFWNLLRGTNVLVAPHHGRESGYCRELFDYWRPELVLVSDGPKEFETQEVDYGRHAQGIVMNGSWRGALTTRKDGNIRLIIPASGSAPVVTRAECSWP